DQQGVEVDAEGLHQALLDGVADRGGRRDVGDRAHARLVGEHAALDAVDDHGTQPAADHGLRVEGLDDDLPEHAGQLAEVHAHDDDADEQVERRHDRDHVLGDVRDAAHAAEDDPGGQQREQDAEHGRQPRQALGVGVDGHGAAHGV